MGNRKPNEGGEVRGGGYLMAYDEKKANRVIQFVQALRHVKGIWANQKFILEQWQKDELIKPLFGTVNPDGTRQYRTALLAVGRKNGKSLLAAALALYALFADGEYGAEVISAAADRGQASLVFNMAAQMVRMSPELSARCKIIDSQKRIVYYEKNSSYQAISAEAYTKHGMSPTFVVLDELHSSPNRDLWDVLVSGMGARTQPLMLAITTAGFDKHSICWEIWDYARKVRDGNIIDPSFFPLLYEADPDAPWDDVETWKQANPNYGISIQERFLKQECARAQETPAYQNTFRRLYLNQWTTQETRWLDMEQWEACGEDFDMASLVNLKCWAGVDLSTTTDISSCALIFEPDKNEKVHTLSFNWVPGDNIEARVRRDRVPYDMWAKDGFITATEGNVIDHDYIRNAISQDIKAMFPHLKMVGYDPWNATKWAIDLEGDGVPVIQIRQGYKTMSPACKELERLVLGKYLRHNNNPVLTWAMDNVMISSDPAGNIKPAKNKATERIDPAVALVTAIATMLESQGETESPYTQRGIITL